MKGLRWAYYLTVVGGLAWWAESCLAGHVRDQHRRQVEREELAQRTAKARNELHGLATLYRALPLPSETGRRFSASDYDRLVRSDHRPFVFIGSLQDVERSGDHYKLVVEDELEFELDCPQDAAEIAMKGSPDSEWGVLAVIDGVHYGP